MGLIFFSSMLNLLRGPFIPNEISNAVSILKKKKKNREKKKIKAGQNQFWYTVLEIEPPIY